MKNSSHFRGSEESVVKTIGITHKIITYQRLESSGQESKKRRKFVQVMLFLVYTIALNKGNELLNTVWVQAEAMLLD